MLANADSVLCPATMDPVQGTWDILRVDTKFTTKKEFDILKKAGCTYMP